MDNDKRCQECDLHSDWGLLALLHRSMEALRLMSSLPAAQSFGHVFNSESPQMTEDVSSYFMLFSHIFKYGQSFNLSILHLTVGHESYKVFFGKFRSHHSIRFELGITGFKSTSISEKWNHKEPQSLCKTEMSSHHQRRVASECQAPV